MRIKVSEDNEPLWQWQVEPVAQCLEPFQILEVLEEKMAVYTDVFLATETELQTAQLEATHPSDYFPTAYAKYLTHFELAKPEAILEGQDPYTSG